MSAITTTTALPPAGGAGTSDRSAEVVLLEGGLAAREATYVTTLSGLRADQKSTMKEVAASFEALTATLGVLRDENTLLVRKVTALESTLASERAVHGAEMLAATSLAKALAKQVLGIRAEKIVARVLKKYFDEIPALKTRFTTDDSGHLTGHDTHVGRRDGSYYCIKVHRHSHSIDEWGSGGHAILAAHFGRVSAYLDSQKMLDPEVFSPLSLDLPPHEVKQDDLIRRFVTAQEPSLGPYQNNYIIPTLLPWPPESFRAVCAELRTKYADKPQLLAFLGLMQNAERLGLGKIVASMKPHEGSVWSHGNRAPHAPTLYRGLSYGSSLKFVVTVSFEYEVDKEQINVCKVVYQMPATSSGPAGYDFAHYGNNGLVWNRQSLSESLFSRHWPGRELKEVIAVDIPEADFAMLSALVEASFERHKREAGVVVPIAGEGHF